MSHLGKRLSALIDGELDGAQRERVLAHLARCETCLLEAATLRMLKQRMRALGDATTVADALTERLIALAGQSDQPGRSRWPVFARRPAVAPGGPRGGRRRHRAAGLAAAMVTLAAVGIPVAGFALGGPEQPTGPRVTPAVDVFIVQHAITTGEEPARRESLLSPVSSTPASASPASASPGGSRRAGRSTPAVSSQARVGVPTADIPRAVPVSP